MESAPPEEVSHRLSAVLLLLYAPAATDLGIRPFEKESIVTRNNPNDSKPEVDHTLSISVIARASRYCEASFPTSDQHAVNSIQFIESFGEDCTG
jgi:hypothetical protein